MKPLSNIVVESIRTIESDCTRTCKASKYIDAFRTSKGLELAIERNRQHIFVWTELISGMTSILPFSPLRIYSANDGRNSNLNQLRSPRLQKGRPACYWRLENTEQLQQLLKAYLCFGPLDSAASTAT
jgi:hypothetical protein